MSVEKLFWHDPYLDEADAAIREVKDNIVTLDRTIIYAFSGGQQSDEGWIADFPVRRAVKIGREIEYTLDAGHGLQAGQAVRLKIDLPLRRRLARLHSAAELALEMMDRHFGKPERLGANINGDKARVDYYWEGSVGPILPDLQTRLNDLILADKEITSTVENEEKELRYLEIESFGRVLCGGTHVRKTGEIGRVRLRRDNIGKGKERIEIFLVEP